MTPKPRIAVTLDIDWAPDFVIDFVAERLVEASVCATWFVTHDSAAVRRLRQHPDLFELGIHPNFLPGSTHGKTIEEVLRHCLGIVPTAVSMRIHALVQSSPLMIQVLRHSPVRCDVSLLLPRARHAEPVEFWYGGERLLRVPFVWEDDMEMEHPRPIWSARDLRQVTPGLLVLGFHPIHIYLNSASMKPYEDLKRRVGRLPDAARKDVDGLIAPGGGTQTMFCEMLQQANTLGACRAVDILSDWNNRSYNDS